ncbi:MAG: heme o synthase [Actinomycetota bacterium]
MPPTVKLLRRLSTAAAAMTVALVILGGTVRATGSGLGCPDWPRCHGRFLPPLELHSLIEYSHRLTAVLVVILVVTTAWVAWRRERADAGILWPAVAAVGVVVLQTALGAIVVSGGLKALLVMAHFATAMVLLALVVGTATSARVRRRQAASDPVPEDFRRLLWWTTGAVALLLLAGALVRGAGASLAFLDWPLMGGRIVPDLGSTGAAATFTHRALALVAAVVAGALAIRAKRLDHSWLKRLAWIGFGLILAQAGVGAATVLSHLAPAAVAGHVTGAALGWTVLVALTVAAHRMSPRATEPAISRPRARAAAYIQLMKPDIIVLLLVTTVPAMVLAAQGLPPWWLVGATLLGGTLAAGGANAINCYLDRDIDAVMARTRGRPLPTRQISPDRALRFGVILTAAAFLWLAATVNLLAAGLVLVAVAFYVLVYTAWMKRLTPQNIVIGGAAGAVPVLVGWAAVTGGVALPAWVLFAIVFFWTPPHFWALSLRYAGEYASAGIPMMPVVAGKRTTAQHIVLYSLQLVVVTLLLYPAAGMGAIYLVSAIVLGGLLILSAVQVLRDGGARSAMNLFRFSITYLGLLFAAVAVDQLVRAGI